MHAVLVVALAGLLDALLGAPAASALAVIAPLVAFLAAALTLASLVERSGLADRVACALAAVAGGSSLRLYVLGAWPAPWPRRHCRSMERSC